MAGEETIMYTTGKAGSGKTLTRCAVFLIDEFFKEFPTGDFWSNFPIGEVPEWHTHPPKYKGETFIDRIAKEAARKYGGHPDDYASRIKLIPEEVELQWIAKDGDPADFWADKDVAGSKITIDEIHNFCGRKDPKQWKAKWQAVLGELRHRGAELEVISQSEMKVAMEIEYEAGKRMRLQAADSVVEPFTGVKLGHWYELVAKYTGETINAVFQVEETPRGKRWIRNATKKIRIDARYFGFYNSFSAPKKGGKAGRTRQRPHERYGHFRILLWFLARNWLPLGKRVAIIGIICWLMFFGGARQASAFVQYRIKAIGEKALVNQRKPVRKDLEPKGTTTEPPAEIITTSNPPANDAKQPVEADARDLRIAELEAKLIQKNVDIVAAEKKIDKLDQEIRDVTALVMITPDEALFKNGFLYRVGEVVQFGEYHGAKIERIEYRHRTVWLDNGTVLRLGSGSIGLPDDPETPAEPTDVPADISIAESTG